MTAERILVNSTHIAILLCGSICTAPVALSQDAMAGKPVTPSAPKSQIQSARVGSSPFTPPNGSDTTFVVDQSRGLDTGCTYRGEGPLVFSVQINRVIGDLDRLLASGMISPTAILRMPAFDVDIGADISSGAAEFNRVTLNGHLVPGEFLTGADNAWKLNVFEVPIEWINFPPDPGPGAIPTPTFNTIRIDIDVANVEEHWCTSIDWGEISVEVARPVVMVHGIRSSGATWGPWVSRLDSLGVPNSNRLDMGTLDSIGNNAVKIAAEIAGARSRWGVEKVNLIGHSKGGIDARHYAENASDVEQLIQLGTPNAGTPLADVAQSSAIVLTGFTGASMINAMAGPAGFQLTTGYMTRYNLMHGGNSNARYTAVAGDYDPDCNPEKPLCRPIDRLLLSLSGRPGDTIVSVASVHALPYADNRIHRSIGDDATAMHTEIHSNGPVFDGVLFKQVRSYRTAATAETAVPLSRTATIGGVLQAGEIADHSFPLDQSGDLLVSLMYTDSELRLTLESPSGKIFDPKAASASDRIAFQAADILGGRMAVYAISSAEVGLWTAHVAGDFVSGTAAYGINGWIDDAEIKLRGETAGTVVPTGEPVILHAYVDQVGRPVSGAAVSALVAGPDDWTRIVDLLDDGVGQDSKADDGIYTGTLDDTSQAGLYRIAFIANRAASITEPAFSREAFGLAAVSNSASRLADRFYDQPIDSDGDGLFDRLVVGVEVTVTDSADYRVFGVLTDKQGNRHEAGVATMLTPGSHTVQLPFDGGAIHRNGIDGPYELSVVRFAEEDAETLAVIPLGEIQGAYATEAYNYNIFEHAPLRVTGNGSSSGIDTDGDELIDLLDVRVELVVDFGGFYQWSARLVDATGAELGFHAGSGVLTAGIEDLTFQFDGEMIGKIGVDGPYFVSDLLLFGAGQSMVASRVFTTDPLTARQFEGFCDDADADGVRNDLDTCPKSNLEPTVAVGGYDSKVPNLILDNGCSISDGIEGCARTTGNHGQFVSCVASFSQELKSLGIISGAEMGAIQSCSAHARIP